MAKEKMDPQSSQGAMNQRIFDRGLSTEAVSLYLLCCHLEDTRATLSKSNIAGLWNGSGEALSGGITDLETHQILTAIVASDAGETVYRLNDAQDWNI